MNAYVKTQYIFVDLFEFLLIPHAVGFIPITEQESCSNRNRPGRLLVEALSGPLYGST